MSHQDTERLSDERVARAIALAEPGEAEWHEANVMAALAREVQASRKLVADLRAEHACLPDELPSQSWCKQDGFSWPCPTIRMIDEAGL